MFAPAQAYCPFQCLGRLLVLSGTNLGSTEKATVLGVVRHFRRQSGSQTARCFWIVELELCAIHQEPGKTGAVFHGGQRRGRQSAPQIQCPAELDRRLVPLTGFVQPCASIPVYVGKPVLGSRRTGGQRGNSFDRRLKCCLGFVVPVDAAQQPRQMTMARAQTLPVTGRRLRAIGCGIGNQVIEDPDRPAQQQQFRLLDVAPVTLQLAQQRQAACLRIVVSREIWMLQRQPLGQYAGFVQLRLGFRDAA